MISSSCSKTLVRRIISFLLIKRICDPLMDWPGPNSVFAWLGCWGDSLCFIKKLFGGINPGLEILAIVLLTILGGLLPFAWPMTTIQSLLGEPSRVDLRRSHGVCQKSSTITLCIDFSPWAVNNFMLYEGAPNFWGWKGMLSWSFGVSEGLLKLGFYFLHHWELYSSSLFTCRDPHNCRDHGCRGLNGLRPLLWPPLIFGTYTAWFPQVAWPQTADPRLTLFPRASLGCRWSWFSQSSLWPRQLLLPPPYFRSIHMSYRDHLVVATTKVLVKCFEVVRIMFPQPFLRP